MALLNEPSIAEIMKYLNTQGGGLRSAKQTPAATQASTAPASKPSYKANETIAQIMSAYVPVQGYNYGQKIGREDTDASNELLATQAQLGNQSRTSYSIGDTRSSRGGGGETSDPMKDALNALKLEEAMAKYRGEPVTYADKLKASKEQESTLSRAAGDFIADYFPIDQQTEENRQLVMEAFRRGETPAIPQSAMPQQSVTTKPKASKSIFDWWD